MRFSVIAAALLLAGCQAAPQPFAGQDAPSQRGILLLPDRSGIVILPIDGLLPEDGLNLQSALAAALHDRNVPASFGGGNSQSYFLLGERLTGAGGENRLRWTLYDALGKQVGAYEQIVPGSRLKIGAKSITRQLAEEVAPALAAMVQQEMPVEYRPPAVFMGPVAGAPSDGNLRLRTLVAALLRRAGLEIATAPNGRTLSVSGAVRVAPPRDGSQNVAMEWTITDAAGNQIGTVSLAHNVPAGSLDAGWGPVATDAATAAAAAISETIRQLDWSKLPQPRESGRK